MKLLTEDFAVSVYDKITEAGKVAESDPSYGVAKLRTILENIFKELTRDSLTSFTDLFARIRYCEIEFGFDRGLSGSVHTIRKLANRVVHDELKVNYETFSNCAGSLAEVIEKLSEVAIPEDLAGFKPELMVREDKPQIKRETIPLLKGVVISFGTEGHGDSGKFLPVHIADSESGDTFIVYFWENSSDSSKNFYYTARNLFWEYCTVNLLNLKLFNPKENLYATTDTTQIVIEPDYLVDVTDIAKCFSINNINYMNYFLSKLFDKPSSQMPLLKGNIINKFLDYAFKDPAVDPETVFTDALRENLLPLASLNHTDLTDIITSIKTEHSANIYNTVEQNKDKLVSIEPTFFSPLYGLNGRLDVMLGFPGDKDRKDVFELKSGKPWGGAVSEDHRIQVVCYNMLLRSVFGHSRKGVSSVLYSGQAVNPLRNVTNTLRDENLILYTRNLIIRILQALENRNYKVFEKLNTENFGTYQKFDKEHLQNISIYFKNAPEAAVSYYREQLSFLLRELKSAKTGAYLSPDTENKGFSSLWNESVQEKLERQNAISGLIISNYDQERDIIDFNFEDMPEHNFRAGDLCILYSLDDGIKSAVNSRIMRGSILRIDKKSISLKLSNKIIDSSHLDSYAAWVLEHDFYESNYWGQIKTLFNFVTATETKRKLLFGLTEPRIRETAQLSPGGMLDNQKEILNKALSAQDYFLLQGPPGTGKTSVMLVNLVQGLLDSDDGKIAICAFTNRAVDEICLKLKINSIPFMKLNSNGNAEEYDTLSNTVREFTPEGVKNTIQECRVFVSTISSLSTRIKSINDISPIQTLIVDEASQVTESQIIGLVTATDRFIMIGDQNQLPPVVTQSDKFLEVANTVLKEYGLRDFRESLFERLYRRCNEKGWNHATGMLKYHFRMHADIADLVNPFYNNELTPADERQIRSEVGFFVPDPASRLSELFRSRSVFIPSCREHGSKYHEEEAKRTAQLIKYIYASMGSEFKPDTVGVVTPWRTQISQIKKHLSEELADLVTIDTVERFQGSERDIIIVSLAVTNSYQMKSLQALDPTGKTDRKLLVTASRAREVIIFNGHEEILKTSIFYRDLIERIKAKGGYVQYETARKIFGK